MINTENKPLSIAEQRAQIHDCLHKLVEIKLILQRIPEPLQPKESIRMSNSTGELWCDIRSNIAAIYTDFLEMEVNHE